MPCTSLSPVGFLRRHAPRVFIGAAVIAGAAGLLSLLIPNKYTAAVVLLPPTNQADLGGLLTGGGGTMALSRALGIDSQGETDLYLGVLRSVHINRTLVTRFALQKVYGQKDIEKAGKKLSQHTGVALTNEGFIRVTVTEPDRKLAADLANAYAEELDVFLRLNTNTSARHRREFMDQRLEETQRALASAEDSLRDYQTQSRLPLLGAESQASSAAAELLAQKVQREIELGTLQRVSTGGNPRVEQLREEVSQIDRQLGRIPPATTEIARLMRNAKIQEQILLVLTEERERARLLELKTMGSVEVVDHAEPPLHKSQPHRTLIIIGAFGLAVLAGFTLQRLREPADAG
jgi:tyrosine-protein kinase Etk/Wzc